MDFLQYIVAFLIVYLCVYALFNRICQCIEHCATAKAYSKFRENELEAAIQKSTNEKINIR